MNKLLELLSKNARATNAELAVMTGYTEVQVAAQIAQWERDGIIRGYGAIVDWDRTDRDYVAAHIELKVSPRRDLGFEGIADTIMRFDEVENVTLMSGGYDLSVTVTGRSFKDIAIFVSKRLATLDSVLSTATHFELRRYKTSGVALLGEEKDERGAL